MKKKFGIKTRVFLGFGFFVITTINIFLYLFYLGNEESFINGIKTNIDKHYKIVTNIIDNQKGGYIVNIPNNELDKIKNLGFFIYIGENDRQIIDNYRLGYFFYGDDIIFRGDYKGYNILIGKNISDFLAHKGKILEIMLLADLIGIIIVIMMVYIITNRLLKPLLELSQYISKYDIEKDKSQIKNNYGDSEIGLITDSINNLISKSKNILEGQKRFIQDSNHELKTPLMQIDTNIELLEEKIKDKNILNKLENIKKSTENINKIVSNLGFILREENKIVNNYNINIGDYLEKFIQEYIEEANKKNIEIKILKKSKLEIKNNTYFLDRLFGNLIQNSIFYNNGNGVIKISIFEDRVWIEDNGIGINKEEIEKVFGRFYRNQNSCIYNKEGNGLGLTIVKKICDDFYWEINVYSTQQEGTKFEIIFTK